MNEDPIKEYFSKLGKKSWKKQKKKKNSAYMREMQRKSVEARKKNKKDVDK